MSTARGPGAATSAPSVRRSEGRWPIGTRADGSPLALPYLRWEGGPGAHLYIGITIHGDEITGQASLWRVGAWLEQSVLHGTVTAVPVQNPEGFNYAVRGVPGRTVDPNRAYPGDAAGETMERITARLTDAALSADAAIDVHTAGWAMPYVLLDPVADAAVAERTRGLARATGITLIEEFAADDYEKEGLAASLPPAMLAAGKPAFTLELGGHGHIEWSHVEAGAVALRNAIRHLGIVAEESEGVKDVPVYEDEGHRRTAFFCDHGGLVEFVVRPGDPVTAGKRIARVRDVYGRVIEEILSPRGGFVLALTPLNAVWTGAYLGEIAAEE
jgi:predicted deacylase